VLVDDSAAPKLENVQVLYHEMPTLQSTLHYGSRIVFAPDGTVFITQGERSIEAGRTQAQDLKSDFGKVVRINKDGSIPKDNPYADGKDGARPEIFDRGHRNVQAAALNPVDKKLYTVEHGTRGGDELNQPEAGKDYGWPTIAYGIEYSGGKIREGLTQKEGMEQPLYYWDPVIAPGGMTFYTGKMFPKWKNSLFIGSLKSMWLVRLTLKNKKVVGEEWLLRDLGKRVRLPVEGPDGALYVITDEEDGQIIRIAAPGK
jgi:glucose/arabinose dehydrogenase